jgi:hypothetical protein
MFLLIYSIYAEALAFFRKNLFLILPFAANEILKSIASGFGGTAFGLIFWLFFTFLIPSLIDVYVVILVFKAEKAINQTKSLTDQINKYYSQAIVVYALGYMLAALAVFPSMLLYSGIAREVNSSPNSVVVYIFLRVFGFLLFVGNMLGVRILIYRNMKAFPAFIKSFSQLNKTFYYYLFVYLFSLLLAVFPSTLAFFYFSFIQILPIAEFEFYINSDLLKGLFNIVISIWFSIAATYAFLEKNNNPKYAS